MSHSQTLWKLLLHHQTLWKNSLMLHQTLILMRNNHTLPFLGMCQLKLLLLSCRLYNCNQILHSLVRINTLFFSKNIFIIRFCLNISFRNSNWLRNNTFSFKIFWFPNILCILHRWQITNNLLVINIYINRWFERL